MMTGKNNKFGYFSLVCIIIISVFLSSYFSTNYQIISIFLGSIILGFLVTKYGLKIFKKLKLLQKIREDVPYLHSLKENTPTMGGAFFIPVFLTISLIYSYPLSGLKIIFLTTILSFFCIGILDDFLSIKGKSNLGLKANQKFVLQFIVTYIFSSYAIKNGFINSEITFFNHFSLSLDSAIMPFSILTIVGLSNAVNLTDGLDGLAAGCSSIVLCGLGTEILLSNNGNDIIYSIISFTLSGLCLGFLKFNKYPAKIFMGDTGSLCIGAVIGSICLLTSSYVTLFIISGIFIIEALSVIAQVTYFKITKKLFNKGKRILLMSPLHHHYELQGVNEVLIVETFWKINIVLAVLGIVLKMSF